MEQFIVGAELMKWMRDGERERDAEQDWEPLLLNIDFETCESIRIVRRQNCDSYMNIFMCTPSFLFLFSKAAQHGLAPFAVCSRGRGLSGFMYQTREITSCSPYESFL